MEKFDFYKSLEKSFNSALLRSCPVALVRDFTKLCLSENGFSSFKSEFDGILSSLEKIINNEAKKSDIEAISETAEAIISASGDETETETAKFVLKSLTMFKSDYISHVEEHKCDRSFKSIPCVNSCPAHVDIPGYIALVSAGKYESAISLIRRDNPFPSVCGFVCDHPCEKNCRRGSVDSPVNIREIKRFAAERAFAVPLPEKAAATGKSVAVIGGGPSGLTTAYYLALMGHSVTVFEKRNSLGGMLRYGIPRYRLPAKYLDGDIESILTLGIEVKLGVDIGKDEVFDNIKENYDYIYLSIGAHIGKKLGIPGESSAGVISAIKFLREVENGKHPDFSKKRVIVIGGGNVAIDAARTSIRLGAEKVICAYRRKLENMNALPGEVENAVAEGCDIKTLLAPVEIRADKYGNAVETVFAPQILEKDEHQNTVLKNSGDENIVLPSDIVIVAIGQTSEISHFSENGAITNGGVFVTDKHGEVCGVSKVFSGGDCVTGPSTVINAIEAGKNAAKHISAALGSPIPSGDRSNIPFGDIKFIPESKRMTGSEIPVSERKGNFDLVENGLSEEETLFECSRCLRCDRRGIGAFK